MAKERVRVRAVASTAQADVSSDCKHCAGQVRPATRTLNVWLLHPKYTRPRQTTECDGEQRAG
eukprot:356953-Rhodomonas_salina.1